MKNILYLFLTFVLVGGGTYWFMHQKNDKTSLTAADKDFAYPDTKNIGKIFMVDRRNHTIALEKNGEKWLLNGKYTANANAIKNILELVEKVRVRFVPSKNATKNIVEELAKDGIKVEIYDNNKQLVKCWYLGGSTNDELGTHMIMDGAEQPYVCDIPTMQGELRPRLMMIEQDWRDKSVFAEPQNNIQSAYVEYLDQKSKSFKINLVNGEYIVTPFYDGIPKISKIQKKNYAESYLKGFESIIAEAIDNMNKNRESIVTSQKPFAVISVTNKQGVEKKVSLFPIQKKNAAGEVVVVDGRTIPIDRYFADCNNGDFFLVQDGPFRKLFWDYSAFF
jgi:hypothetical protein